MDLKDRLFPDMPNWGTGEEWYEWETKSKKERPIAWFMSDTLPFWFNETFWWPLEIFIQEIRYRTTHKYHIIEIDHKPGYIGNGDRMLYAAFTILTHHVEIEKPSFADFENSTQQKIISGYMPELSDKDKDNYIEELKESKESSKNKNNREIALEYLDWEISLEEEDGNNHQSENAKEIKELYLWWKDVRPLRIEPYENKFYKQHEKMKTARLGETSDNFWKDTLGNNDTQEENDIYHKAMKLSNKLEESYEKEDLHMFTRLISIRNSLMT